MDIKYEMLEKELNAGKIRSIYLLYGEERYLLDTVLKKIKKQFGDLMQGINYILLDETNSKDFIFNIEVPAFGYDKKLIIVKNSGLFQKNGRKKEPNPFQKEVSQYIEEHITMIEEMVNLVFLEEQVDKNVMYETIFKHGVICHFQELKPNEIVNRLKNICTMYQVKVENSTLQYLIETCGTNLQILMNEIRKLIEYAGKGGIITKEVIDSLAIQQIESVIFDLTDDLGNRKTSQAMEVLDNLIYQKEPLQKILITLYNHFKKLYLCTIAIKFNKDIVSALDLKPNQTFLVNKYKRQTSYFKEEELKQILQEFVKIDEKSKIGQVDIDVALKSVLCNYCS